MADFTIHPKAATTIKAAEVAEHLLKMAAWRGRVHEGFAITTSGTSLNATIATGRAYIMGREVGEPAVDASVAKALTGSATNHVYLDDQGNIIINTTGVAPANSIKLWEVTANASGVTGTTDRREFAAGHDVALRAQSLEADGADAYLRGHRVHLRKAQPEVKWEDTADGMVTVLRATSGKLRVIDIDAVGTETVKQDDLRNLGLASYQLRSEKGQASGYPSLDNGGLVPRTQLPAATSTGQGAVELADAGVGAEVPKSLAAAAAVGVSPSVARADHEHPHGDRSADAGVTHHGMAQINGVLTDAQHGSRGGGALHTQATGAQHGFMPSTDKAKLDAATEAPSPSTVVMRDGSGKARVADVQPTDDPQTIANKRYVAKQGFSKMFLIMGA
jgi:hypothetical protein